MVASSEIVIQRINYNSDSYYNSLGFRYKILRQPINLGLSEYDLKDEDKQIHIVANCGNLVVGCVLLKPIDQERVRLRQMAVDDVLQGKGYGRKLVRFAEKIAQENGFKSIEMIARITAIGFYQKLGYQIESEEYEEVTLRCVTMRRLFSE